MTMAIAVSSRRAAGAASGPLCAGRTAALAVGGQAAVADGATALAGDHIVTALSGDGSISAKAIVTTNLVAEASRCQGLGGLAAAALGRAVTCSLLVAEGVEEDETFQVKFQGDGPLRGVTAIANGRLEARGYVGNPAVELPLNGMGKFDVGGAVGRGSLQVVRAKNLPGEVIATPYTSITEIQSGEIPEDINWFLHESEQKEGALAAGVFVQGTDGGADLNGVAQGAAGVVAAAGWYVQLLPFASDETVGQLQTNLQALASRSPTTLAREGCSPEDVLRLLLDGMDPNILVNRKIPSLRESCPCSEERVLRSLKLLPRAELEETLETEESLEVKCEFCGIRYAMSPDEIRQQL